MLLMGGTQTPDWGGVQNPACPRERVNQARERGRTKLKEDKREREREKERGVRAKGRVWVIRQKQKVK